MLQMMSFAVRPLGRANLKVLDFRRDAALLRSCDTPPPPPPDTRGSGSRANIVTGNKDAAARSRIASPQMASTLDLLHSSETKVASLTAALIKGHGR